MNRCNSDIRGLIKSKNIKQWQVAQKLGIAESTLIRWLRTELPQANKEEFIKAINELAEEGELK